MRPALAGLAGGGVFAAGLGIRLRPTVVEDGVFDVVAGTLEPLKQASCPYEFDREDAEAEEYHRPSGTWRNQHHDAEREQGESDDRDDRAFGLLQCFIKHR